MIGIAHHLLCISVIILIVPFPGCLNVSKTPIEPEGGLERINFANGIKLHPTSYQLIPILAPLIIEKKINFEINESGMVVDDASLFSSRVAITFWNNSKYVFVVNSYNNLLLVSPLAKIVGAPILIYGNTTQQVIEIIKPETIFSIGNIPTESVRLTPEEIIEHQIQFAKDFGLNIDYLVLVNSNDSNAKLLGLSSFGALLACYHNGLIFEATNEIYPEGAITEENASLLIKKIRLFYKIIGKEGINLKHVCIVGGADAIPQVINTTIVKYGCDLVASDNYWGDEDGDPWHPDFGLGRFIAPNLVDAWSLFTRYFNYYSYINHTRDLIEIKWQDCAFVYQEGVDVIAVTTLHTERGVLVFMQANFTVYQDHGSLLIPGVGETVVIPIIEKSNFIRFKAHGNSEGSSLDFRKVYFCPSVMFHISCYTGKIDGNVSVDSGVVYNAIHAGLATYVAPTGPTSSGYRIPTDGIHLNEFGSDPLATSFFKYLAEDNLSVGLALTKAKRYPLNESGINPAPLYWDVQEAYHYTLYGDPAFNPYEPCNEGTNYGS